MRIVSFAGFVYPTFEAESSVGVKVRDNSIPLRNGAYDADGSEAVIEPFTVSKRFVVVPTATESIDAQIDRLKARLNRSGTLVAEMDDGEIRQVTAKTTALEVEQKAGAIEAIQQPVVHTVKVDYPFWLRTNDLGWRWGGGVKRWGDSLPWGIQVLSQALTATSTTFNIDTSPGTAPIRRGQIALKPRTGASFTNVVITNTRNNQFFSWIGTVTANQTLLIDLLPQSIKRNGVSVYSTMFVPATQLEWLKLEQGSELGSSVNPIRVQFLSVTGTVDLTWTYARHFL